MNDQAVQAPEPPQTEHLMSQVQIAIRRYETMQKSPKLDASLVLAEMAGTVLPILGDTLAVVVALEEHASWASEELERMSAQGTRSQLLPEDAMKFRNFIEAVVTMSEESLKNVEAGTPHAAALAMVVREGRELVELVDEITVDPDAVEPGEPEEEEEPEEHGDEN